jgi:hypothetical protein
MFAGAGAGAGAGDNPTACALEVLVFPAAVDVLLFVIVLFGFRGSIDPVIEVCVSQSQAIKKRQHVNPENRNSPQYITLTFNTQKFLRYHSVRPRREGPGTFQLEARRCPITALKA